MGRKNLMIQWLRDRLCLWGIWHSFETHDTGHGEYEVCDNCGFKPYKTW